MGKQAAKTDSHWSLKEAIKAIPDPPPDETREFLEKLRQIASDQPTVEEMLKRWRKLAGIDNKEP